MRVADLWVLGFHVDVIQSATVDDNGEWDPKRQRILLSEDLAGQAILHTLYHEVMHAILWFCHGQKSKFTEEECCDAAALLAPMAAELLRVATEIEEG